MALWALPRCWAHLAGVLGGEKIYLGSSIIMNIYPALSLVIGGRDRMDCSRRIWMTCSIYRTRFSAPGFSIWAHLGADLNGVKQYLGSITLIKTYPALFSAIGGRDGMDANGAHWMTCAINK
jgi:hypothetical protein